MGDIQRFSLCAINAPLDMGFDHDKRLQFAHSCHDKKVLVLSTTKAGFAKCVPLGWDDESISDWGLEVPVEMLTVEASPMDDTKQIKDVFGGSTTFSQAKSKLDQYGRKYTQHAQADGTQELVVSAWQVKATYNILGELTETALYTPSKPTVHPIAPVT